MNSPGLFLLIPPFPVPKCGRENIFLFNVATSQETFCYESCYKQFKIKHRLSKHAYYAFAYLFRSMYIFPCNMA